MNLIPYHILIISTRFRWAVCQLDVLRQCRKTRDITDTLEQLPTTLDQTYERILAGIDIKDHPELFSILYWLTSSRRPLTLQEMAEAAIIPAPDQTFDPEARLFHFSEVLRICGSLITCSSIDLEGNQTMRFAHYSVQEFLLSGRGNHFTISIANSRNHTMGCCIVYLQYIKTIPDPKPDHLPLLQYVAQYWFEHLKAVENVNSNVVDLAYGLFEDNFPMHAPKWLQIYEPCTASPETHLSLLSSKIRVTLSYPGPLFYAVQHGLFHAVRRLLERGVSVNELHGIELDLDRLFSFSKNPYVYELLLTYLDSGIGYLTTRQTALQLAVQMGNKELVELLLKFSADPNICATPIQRPSHSRSILPNMQLYQRSMNSKSIAVRYPLGDAMRIGYSEIVSLLLAHGAIPDVPIKGYASVIHAAARRGYHEVVSHLILAGADVNVRGLTGEFDNATVLSAACSQPYVDVVRLLIKSGADLDTVDIPYTALQIASWAEHEEIVRTLLETGADPNLVGQAWGIDSYLAGTYGLSKREKLCSNSCDWNMKVTPLAMASILGNRMIVLSLLEAGADKNTEGCIQHAAKAQNWTVVRLLIEAGANVHATAAQQIHLPSLVYSATSTGELDMVRQLLDIGADVTRPYKRQTPLGAAMINGHFQVAELLRAYDPIYTTSRTAYVDIMNRLKARQEQILIGSKIGEEETLLPAISGSNQTCVGDDASVTWL
jgi:ankyrin repeat protein